MRQTMNRSPVAVLGVVAAILVGLGALAGTYVAADRIVRTPPAQTEVLPERSLRGFDPITVTFTSDVGRPGPADDVTGLATIKPAWPGAWTFVDARTLQFRPAEPWPALHRFAVEAKGASKVLTTMMTAPESMSPDDGSTGLAPFRTLTLTFPQALPEQDLKNMIRLEVRDLPGLKDARPRPIDQFTLSLLPRKSEREPATWAIGLQDDVPEGSMLVVSVALALGDEKTTLWQGKAATRTAFRLEEVACASARLGVLGEPNASAEQALDCGSRGEEPQLLFSAPVGGIGLTALKKLVRLEPAVADLTPRVSGRRVTLTGRFVPETLYRLRLGDAAIFDEHGRRLSDPGEASVHFFVGKKRPHLRVKRGQLTVEQNGPRMLPLSAVGDTRADVRIHRVDPRHTGLWPFGDDAVVIDEGSDPPFPGEEPAAPPLPGTVGARELHQHLRLLGSPLISRLVPLPATTAAGGSFGLDLGPLLDSAPGVGVRRPGTYLVGVRRLEGRPERAWARVQVTNLTLTAVEERQRVVFVVRAVDSAAPVGNATVTVEAIEEKTGALKRRSVSTDADGRASMAPEAGWDRLVRILVEKGDDVLVLDPNEAPPRFENAHWSGSGGFLSMLTEPPAPAPKNDATLGFLFSERPIYRPGETVYLKGFVREKRDGVLTLPALQKVPTPKGAPVKMMAPKLTIKVTRPGGDEVTLSTTTTDLYGGDAAFIDKDPVTGWFTARLFLGDQATPVATRRFQIEAYRIPTFEVRLQGPERAPLDRPFKMTASARYYAGGSVADQPIRWTVTRRPAWHTPKGREGFLFASSTQFARPDAGQRAEQVSKTSALNELGSDAIEMNPEKDLDGSPRIYRFEATVTGADDQEVSAVSEVLALPPFVLGMKLERFKKEAVEITPQVIAVGVDDKTIAGQKIDVRLSRRTWQSHLRESHFATGQASYVTEQEDTLVKTMSVVTTTEPLAVPLPIDRSGVYIVELVSRDKLGRVQTVSADLYVGGKEPVAWQKGQAGVFELVADKVAFVPGDTANVVVKSPFQTAKGLLIVETPTGNTYRAFDVSGGAATVSIAIDKSATPNLPVHVVLSRGRLGEGSGDDAPWRPQTVAASLDLEVKPTRNALQVKVEHPEQARPGDSIDVAVTLKDDRGAPVDGEATVWLVDEAVLALAKEGTLDPLTALITRNQRDTSVSDTRNSLLGRLLEEESPGGDGGDGEDGTGKASRRVRKNFQTVPYWQATVVVKGGRAAMKIPLSDDLTNFKVRAVAVSGAERAGLHESTLKVRLPVIVQPQLPRFVRQGDRFDGGGVARLVEGDGGAGVVKAEFKGPVVERKRSRDVALVKDKAVSVTFPVEVSAQASDAPLVVKMEVLKKKDGQGDAFEVTIPVLPDVQWQTFAAMSQIGQTPVTLPAPPEAPRPGTARQVIVATHVPGLLEVVGAIDSLVAYPHGCLEQKMARLSPFLSLSQLKTRLDGVVGGAGLGGTSLSKGHLERLLAEMPAHQDDKGLFGYWPGGSGDVQLTARALEWMAMAKESGATVDEAVRARAEQAVLASLRSDAGFDPALLPWRASLMAQSLRALSRAGAVDDAYLADLLRARKTLDAVGRADLALAALTRGGAFAKDVTAMKDELWSSVTFQMVDGRRAVVGLNDPRAVWGGRVLGSSTSALSTVLEALVRLDPTNRDLPVLLDAVLQRGRGPVPGFGSTWDNRAAVAAILAYVDVAAPAGQTTTLTLGSEKRVLDGTTKFVRIERDDVRPLQASASGVPVQARTTWRYLPVLSGDRLPAKKQGFLVQRSMTVYPAAGGPPRRVDDVRAAEQKVQVGDVVELHVTVTSDQLRHHVAVVMPFAAGFEPLNPELKTSNADAVPSERDTITPTAWARVDHENRAYFTTLPKGTFSLHFRVRATTPGSFTHPGAFTELMYDSSVQGRSDGSRLIVERAAGEAAAATEKPAK